MEVHSNKTQKTAVLDAIARRLEYRGPGVDLDKIKHAITSREEARKDLTNYVQRMNDKVGDTDFTVYSILWGNCIREKKTASFPASVKKARISKPSTITRYHKKELEDCANALEETLQPLLKYGKIEQHPWRGMCNETLTPFQVDQFLTALDAWKASLNQLTRDADYAAERMSWPLERTANAVSQCARNIEALIEPEDSVSEELLTRLQSPVDQRTLSEALGLLKRMVSALTSIESKLLLRDTVLDQGSKRIKSLQDEIHALNLTDCDIETSKTRADKQRQQEQLIRAALAPATQLCRIFGFDSVSTRILFQVNLGIAMLKRASREVLLGRDEHVIAEESLTILEVGAKKAERLRQLAKRLADFDLSLAPASEEIRRTGQELASSGFIASLFKRSCRLARQTHKRLYKGQLKPSRREIAAALAEISAFLDGRAAFESDPRFRSASGRHFNGLETDCERVIQVAHWGQEVRRELPLTDEDAKQVRSLLFAGNLDQIDAAVAVSSHPDYENLMAVMSAGPQIDTKLQDWHRDEDLVACRIETVVTQLGQLGVSETFRCSEIEDLLKHVTEVETSSEELSEKRFRPFLSAEPKVAVNSFNTLSTTLKFAQSLERAGLPTSVKQRLYTGKPQEDVVELKRHAAMLMTSVSSVSIAQQQATHLGRFNISLWIGHASFDETEFGRLIHRIETASSVGDALGPYLEFLRSETEANKKGLGPVLAAFTEAGSEYQRLAEAFDVVFFRSLAEAVIQEDPALNSHSGKTHDQLRRKYQSLDREITQLQRQQLALELTARSVDPGVSYGKAGDLTELALINRQISISRRHIALRALFKRAGRAIQSLKPCFMMSPISVAQFLEPGILYFDLVVMDEASQMPPEDSLGAILRGSQLVVVGDQMQLPPTTFFQRIESTDLAEDDEEQDGVVPEESVLDMAIGCFQPVRRLSWHYRSQHESLIAFSNKEFYNERLVVFPSPHASHKNYGVKLVEVKGIYASHQNRPEAEALVNSALEFMRSNINTSLGIVALNHSQSELITELMDRLYASYPEAECYRARWAETSEPIFVKNLETVQGHERDAIFISTVYGKDAAGNFYQRLGPINGIYGFRRLNVLFTRAKQQIRIFTSMSSSDIRVDKTTKRGVEVLKNYLQFAKSGLLDFGQSSGRDPDSDFERWFAERLESKGFEVVPQLGVAGYFIDLAVRNPDKPGSFLLGLECDGATYHSAKSARDRDRLRQEILERLGWKIYRIWSTDWFRNPSMEFEKLFTVLQELRLSFTT